MASLQTFDEIYARAVVRHGGEEAVEANLPKPKTKRQLGALQDDRVLAEMAKCVFRSGFVWRVVEAKWPGFEEAFHGFEPQRVAGLSDREIGDLTADTRIIRNGKKIESVRDNAAFVCEIADEHGSFGKFLANWPKGEVVELWTLLKKQASRLGGDTGPMMLRALGFDTFMLSRDVVGVLVDRGVVDKKPTSQKALLAAQEALRAWAEECGRPLSQVSRIVAMSHGDVYERSD